MLNTISKLPEGKKIAKEAQNQFDLNTGSEDVRAWQFRKFQGGYLTWDLVELDAMENCIQQFL